MTVIADAASGRIVGYVTLSASQIERAYLPKPQQRNRPDPVPVMLLGQLAVDKEFQDRGTPRPCCCSRSNRRCMRPSIIGSMGVITHPLDDGVRGFMPLGFSGPAV